MKKREFVKELKKNNKGILKFEIYSLIVALLLIGMYFVNKGMFDEQITSLTVFLIISLFIIVAAIVGVVFEIKHEMYIGKLFKQYKETEVMPEYKEHVKNMKTVLKVMILFIVFMGAFIFSYRVLTKSEIKNDDSLIYTTNMNNIIEMEYEDLGSILLKIPKDFGIMTEEYVKMKYPSEDRPSLVYTNEDGSINITLSIKEDEISNGEVEEVTKQMSIVFEKLFGPVNIEYMKKDNHNIGMLNLVTSATDTKVYNQFMIMSVDDKLLMVTFNCTLEYMDEWKDVGDFILKSVVFE